MGICDKCEKINSKAEYLIQWFEYNYRDNEYDKREIEICGYCLSQIDNEFRRVNKPYKIFWLENMKEIME